MMTSNSLLLDTNSGPESSGTGLKSGSAYDLVDLVTLAPLVINKGSFLEQYPKKITPSKLFFFQ